MEELIVNIARSLVDRPEAVRVNTIKGSSNIRIGTEGGQRGFG